MMKEYFENQHVHVDHEDQLRIQQHWSSNADHFFWVYRKIITENNFQIGDDVEIFGGEGVYKFAVYRVQVRYPPDVVVGPFMYGDFVEAWIDGIWWGGIVLGGTQLSSIVYFGYKEFNQQYAIIPTPQLRIYQKWCRSDRYGVWMYKKKTT
ncbi:hypothetical protein LXL04_036741 [Taraxacum kok-saghyz]